MLMTDKHCPRKTWIPTVNDAPYRRPDAFMKAMDRMRTTRMSARRDPRRQFRHAQEVIRCPNPPGCQLRPVASFEAGLAESPHRLHPPEDLFYPCANPLADVIRNVSGGPAIDGGAAAPCGVGGHMRCDLSTPQHRHKVVRVVALIAPPASWVDAAGAPAW